MPLFCPSVAEAIEQAQHGKLLLAVLEESEGDGILADESALQSLQQLPLVAIRLARGTEDYKNFTAMCPGEAPAVVVVGMGRVLTRVDSNLQNSEEVARRIQAAVAQYTMLPMLQHMAAAQQQQQRSSPAASPQADTAVKQVHSIADFDAAVAANDFVVVDFFATWCGPCQRVAPTFARLSLQHKSITFLKVDVDEAKSLAQREGVTSMPTFMGFYKGSRVSSARGADGIHTVLSALMQYQGTPQASASKPAMPSAASPSPTAAASSSTSPPPRGGGAEMATPSGRPTREQVQEMIAKRKAEKQKQQEGQQKEKQEKQEKQQPEEPKQAVKQPAPRAELPDQKKPKQDNKSTVASPSAPKPEAEDVVMDEPKTVPSEVKLSIRLLNGENMRMTLSPETTLTEIRHMHIETGRYAFHMVYPRRKISPLEENTTLHDLGLSPNGTLILTPEGPPPAPSGGGGGGWGSWLSMLNPMNYFPKGSEPSGHSSPPPSETQPQPSHATMSAPPPSEVRQRGGRMTLADMNRKDKDDNEYSNGNSTAFQM